eukprot:TRINITY_DN34124_c0_g1_i4.p1 TRINITY_DN34124_c0_g1~~TRINITY_DN34124_c0_g1_i4.p1  ORF type:complete len:304 (+),score=17.17 TRINITY_DN34124_c0_g1_i4:65-913(+)
MVDCLPTRCSILHCLLFFCVRVGALVVPGLAELKDPTRFHASRAVLHLAFVPEPEVASPGTKDGSATGDDPACLPSEVMPLSFLGRTIGGAFYVDWDDSPCGSYREVGLLSALVTLAAGFSVGAWGGWASHVWVDSKKAAAFGTRVWGLPAKESDIQVGCSEQTSFGIASLRNIDQQTRIVYGVLQDSEESGFPWPGGSVSLPNLSGCLDEAQPGDIAVGLDCRRLLKYPIGLSPRRFRILPGSVPERCRGLSPDVDRSTWSPIFTVELLDVDISVGLPEAC